MEGDGLLHPRGPLPPAIYWRRRLIVLGVALLVLVLLVTKCASGGSTKKPSTKPSAKPSASRSSGSPSAKPSTKASTAPSSSKPPASSSAPVTPASSSAPVSSSSPPAVTQCKAPALQMSVKADATGYPAGTQPVITLTIKNSGTTPCTRDLGAAATELIIKSGPDRIWSSDDCNPGGKANVVQLKPNETRTVSVTWNRKRSKPGSSCVGADAKAGQYRVTGRLGDLTTQPDGFGLS